MVTLVNHDVSELAWVEHLAVLFHCLEGSEETVDRVQILGATVEETVGPRWAQDIFHSVLGLVQDVRLVTEIEYPSLVFG